MKDRNFINIENASKDQITSSAVSLFNGTKNIKNKKILKDQKYFDFIFDAAKKLNLLDRVDYVLSSYISKTDCEDLYGIETEKAISDYKDISPAFYYLMASKYAQVMYAEDRNIYCQLLYHIFLSSADFSPEEYVD